MCIVWLSEYEFIDWKMSATEQMAAMLNELMGPKRNADFGDTNEPDFDEPDVCKHFLVAFCPNEMFRNTKADLGYCSKVRSLI